MLERPGSGTGQGASNAASRFRACERMIAESQNRKRDTSLLGAQLQEMLVRNEKLASKMEGRESMLMELTSANE